MDRTFSLMDEDPDMGPKYARRDMPRFELDDLDLVVNIRAGRGRERTRSWHWEWTDEVDWEGAG